MTANETSAIASLMATRSAQAAYSASCGNGFYAASYLILGTPAEAGELPFIAADLGSAMEPLKPGYRLTLGAGVDNAVGPNDCMAVANPTNSTFYATAVPLTFGETGSRSFATNADNEIWQQSAAEAPAEPFGAPATLLR